MTSKRKSKRARTKASRKQNRSKGKTPREKQRERKSGWEPTGKDFQANVTPEVKEVAEPEIVPEPPEPEPELVEVPPQEEERPRGLRRWLGGG